MTAYRVVGMAKLTWLQFCECEFCEGHEQGVQIAIDRTIEAESEKDAGDITLYSLESRRFANEEPQAAWVDKPSIWDVEQCQDRLMRSAGYATLPGMS